MRVQSLGQEDPLEEENGNPLQYSSLKNPMDRGALQAIVQRVSNSQTQLSDYRSLYLNIFICRFFDLGKADMKAVFWPVSLK